MFFINNYNPQTGQNNNKYVYFYLFIRSENALERRVPWLKKTNWTITGYAKEDKSKFNKVDNHHHAGHQVTNPQNNNNTTTTRSNIVNGSLVPLNKRNNINNNSK